MPNDLANLETQRSKLLEEFLDLGDLRPGSITAVTRRCGKPSCHCAKRNAARTWRPSTKRSRQIVPVGVDT